MKIPLTLVSLLLAAGIARADMVIVQKVDGAGQTGTMTIKVGGDKVRTEVSPQVSTITNTTTGDITTILHAQKSYMVISATSGEAMVAMAMKQAGTMLTGSSNSVTASGKTQKINGYNASEYTFNNGIIRASYWMSTDFPNAQAVCDALAKFRKGSTVDMTKAFAPDFSKIPGVPVKTEMEVGGQKLETELVSASEQTVDPSEYQVPAGYTEIKMPALPQPQQ